MGIEMFKFELLMKFKNVSFYIKKCIIVKLS